MNSIHLQAHIIGLLRHTPCLTFKVVEGAVRRHYPDAARREIRTAVNILVSEGRLRYTQRFGLSQLEFNYERLHRVSERIWLAPAELNPTHPPGGVLIRLAVGASFGCGDHPTTRLALQAIDRAVDRNRLEERAVLDIGTGSGVLALAAVALGMNSALALDIDRLACHEARANVRLNGYQERIVVSDQPLAALTCQQFDLVIANLRPPTLKLLFDQMCRYTAPNGVWVLSGFRCQEMPDLRPYVENGNRMILWEEKDADWGVWLVDVRQSREKAL